MVVNRIRALAVAILLLAFGLPFVSSGHVSAEGGVGIFPVQIQLDEALRGAEYLRTLTIINNESSDLDLAFFPEGDISGWMTFFTADAPDTNLDSVIVPAGTQGRVTLRILVPTDAPNGSHGGTVRFQGSPAGSSATQSAMGVSLGIAAQIQVDVTGEQHLTGSVTDMSVDNAEAGQPPVRLRVRFQNAGNVQTAPEIKWQIKDGSGNVVGDIEYAETMVQPGFITDIVSEWDSTDIPEGTYAVTASVALSGAVIDQRDLALQILPVGTLTRSGVLDRIALEGEPQTGTIAKVVGAFRNTGQIDTHAVLTAEVYRGQQLIQTVESRDRVVTIGELALLDAFFDVRDPGDYTIRGTVNYEGKVTDAQETTFSVGAAASGDNETAASPAPQASGFSVETWALIGLAALAVVGILAFVLGRGLSGASPRHRTGRRGKQTGSSKP